MTIPEKILSYFLGATLGVTLVLVYTAHTLPALPNVPFMEYWLNGSNSNYFLSLISWGALSGLLISFAIQEYKERERAEHARILRDESVSGVTHQMRTSLTAAYWGVETILTSYEKTFSENDHKLLLNIIGAIKNTTSLTANLLDVTKLDMGKLSIALQLVTLGELEQAFEKSVQKFKHGADEKGIALYSTIKLDRSVSLFADTLRLTAVVENLIENAINYAGRGRREVTIIISNDNSSLSVAISDTGIGIPLAEQHSIFSKYYRASNARATLSGGTGIGLYLSKEYVLGHQGTIRFESKEGEGTTFFVTIPIQGNVAVKEFFLKM